MFHLLWNGGSIIYEEGRESREIIKGLNSTQHSTGLASTHAQLHCNYDHMEETMTRAMIIMQRCVLKSY